MSGFSFGTSDNNGFTTPATKKSVTFGETVYSSSFRQPNFSSPSNTNSVPVTAPASGGFSFGSTSTSSTAPAPAPASGGFSFGSTSTTAPATTGGFSFGSTTSAPATTTTPTTTPASGGFSFGSTSTSTAAPTSGGFSFGSTSTSTTPSTGGFSFGSTNTNSNSNSTTSTTPSTGGFSFGSSTTGSGFGFGTNTTGTTSKTGFGSTGGFGFGSTSFGTAAPNQQQLQQQQDQLDQQRLHIARLANSSCLVAIVNDDPYGLNCTEPTQLTSLLSFNSSRPISDEEIIQKAEIQKKHLYGVIPTANPLVIRNDVSTSTTTESKPVITDGKVVSSEQKSKKSISIRPSTFLSM